MKTIQISNGDIDVDPNTGQWNTVDDLAKDGQDVARALLCEYNGYWQEGNEFYEKGLGQVVTDPVGLISTFLSEAVNRLIIKVSTNPDEAKISAIRQLIVDKVNNTDFVFFLEVERTDSRRVGVVERLSATKLDHLINADAALRI
jgi:hypothetical protein